MTKPGPTISCSCGKLRFATRERPIMTVSCYCDSCQSAAAQLPAPSDSPLIGADGGTPFILYRKDRVDWSASKGLREHRLSPESTTRRLIASCCNTPLFLEFQKGHWVSVYAGRVPLEERTSIEMRTMTRYAPGGERFDDEIPSYRTHSVMFMLRLLGAWVAMGFRSPDIALD